MRIAIMGAGAMGSIYAGLLREAGNEVWAIDIRTDHVRAMARDGLRVSGASGDRVVRLHATTDPSVVGAVDLVVIATKAHDARAAASAAAPLIGPDTAVLTIQNGLGSADDVAEVLGADVLVGVVGAWGASIRGPGHVHHHGAGSLRLGNARGPLTPRVEQIASAWRAAGVTTSTHDDVNSIVWEKLICNAAFSGTCALLGCTIGEILDEPNAWAVASRCAREAYEVATASGVAVPFEDPVRYVAEFGARIPGARPSMLLDIIARSRCEIDVINGAIPPRARALGLSAPVNEIVTALVKARERLALSSHARAAGRSVEADAVAEAS